jgi:cupin superfamily acireductone dioxygenase involved in methionine salvage
MAKFKTTNQIPVYITKPRLKKHEHKMLEVSSVVDRKGVVNLREEDSTLDIIVSIDDLIKAVNSCKQE